MRREIREKLIRQEIKAGAFAVGQADGRLNLQEPSRNYTTAENLIEWFRGWKDGQAEYARRIGVHNIPEGAPRVSVLVKRRVSRKPVNIERNLNRRRQDYLRETSRL